MHGLIILFAFIGLIFILRWVSKGLNKVGDSLNKFGDTLADIAASSSRSTTGYSGEKEKDKTIEKIRTLRGEGTDTEFKTNVLKEIDDLTKE